MFELFLALLDEIRAEFAGINRRIAQRPDDVGDSPDVVQVAVGDDDTLDFFLVGFKVFRVRQDEVYSRRFFRGELDAGVNHDDFAVQFHRGHILSDFFHSADGDYPDDVFRRRRDLHSAFDALSGSRRPLVRAFWFFVPADFSGSGTRRLDSHAMLRRLCRLSAFCFVRTRQRRPSSELRLEMPVLLLILPGPREARVRPVARVLEFSAPSVSAVRHFAAQRLQMYQRRKWPSSRRLAARVSCCFFFHG